MIYQAKWSLNEKLKNVAESNPFKKILDNTKLTVTPL